MIKIRRNCKRNEGKSFGARKVQKQGKNRGLRDFAAFAKSALCCKTISQPQQVRCGIATSPRNSHFVAKPFRSLRPLSAKIFAAAKPFLAHECHFAAQWPSFCSCETAAKSQIVKNPNFAAKAPFRRVFRSCKTNFWHMSAISQHSEPHFTAAKWLRKCHFAAK